MIRNIGVTISARPATSSRVALDMRSTRQRLDIDDVFLMLEGQDVMHPVDAVHDVGTRFYQVRTLCGHDVL